MHTTYQSYVFMINIYSDIMLEYIICWDYRSILWE